MKKLIAHIFASLFVLALLVQVASAQFVEQRVWGGTSGGTANAQTLTIQGWPSTPLVGVPIRFLPGNTNTGATTLTIGSSGTYAVDKASPGGPVALTGNELATTQPSEVIFNGLVYVITSSAASTVTVGASNLGNSTLSFGVPVNLQINSTVGSNQLTVTVVGNNGSNASSSNPIPVTFRDTTIANGDPVIAALTSALSFTVTSTHTMGCSSGVTCRLWVYLANNAGTLGLCLYNTYTGGNIIDLNDAVLQNSQSGTSGGSSAQSLYCSISSLSAVAVRRIGYIDIQEATAGTWATGPVYVQLFGPGIHKPGEVVQGPLSATITSATTLSSTTPGTTGLAVSITPTAAADIIEAISYGTVKGNATDTNTAVVKIFRAAGGSAACTTGIGGQIVGAVQTIISGYSLISYDTPGSGTPSQQTYAVCASASTANSGPVFCDQTNGNNCTLFLWEIMTERDPANDNDPLVLDMVG